MIGLDDISESMMFELFFTVDNVTELTNEIGCGMGFAFNSFRKTYN